MACVFIDVLEIEEFFSSGVINDLRSAHYIDIVEASYKAI